MAANTKKKQKEENVNLGPQVLKVKKKNQSNIKSPEFKMQISEESEKMLLARKMPAVSKSLFKVNPKD